MTNPTTTSVPLTEDQAFLLNQRHVAQQAWTSAQNLLQEYAYSRAIEMLKKATHAIHQIPSKNQLPADQNLLTVIFAKIRELANTLYNDAKTSHSRTYEIGILQLILDLLNLIPIANQNNDDKRKIIIYDEKREQLKFGKTIEALYDSASTKQPSVAIHQFLSIYHYLKNAPQKMMKEKENSMLHILQARIVVELRKLYKAYDSKGDHQSAAAILDCIPAEYKIDRDERARAKLSFFETGVTPSFSPPFHLNAVFKPLGIPELPLDVKEQALLLDKSGAKMIEDKFKELANNKKAQTNLKMFQKAAMNIESPPLKPERDYCSACTIS